MLPLVLAAPQAGATGRGIRGAAGIVAPRMPDAVDAGAVQRPSPQAGGEPARPLQLTQGGTLTCSAGGTTELSQTMAAGTSGSVSATPSNPLIISPNSTTCTLSGNIPSGWTVLVSPFALDVSGAGNSGSLDAVDMSGSTFENEGSLGPTASDPSSMTEDVDVADFTNLAGGELTAAPSDTLYFDDDQSSAGTLDNEGTIDAPAGAEVQVGTHNCAAGVDLVLEEGGAVDAAGTVSVQCGGLEVEGGTVSSGALVTGPSTVSLTFGSSVAADSNGTIDLDGASSLSGVIAAGWTVSSTVGFDAAPGAGNAGTLDFLDSGNGITSTGTFTNSGTLDASNATNLDVADLVNSGTVETTTGNGSLDFDYDNATTAGIVENSGTLEAAAGTSIAFGPSNCKTGEDLETESGSTIEATGGISEVCGEVDLDGGTITAAGPLEVSHGNAGPSVTVDFDSGLPAGSGATGTDTVDVYSPSTVLEGTVPSGWTVAVDTGGAATSLGSGATNDGTIDLLGGPGLAGSGTFTNAGTIDATAGTNLDVADLVNSGTIEATSGNGSLDFDYDNATTAGVIDNSGTLSAGSGASVSVGSENCATGEDLVSETGGEIAAAGSFTLQCGTYDVQGGGVTSAGPVVLYPIGSLTVEFAAGLPRGSGGTGDTLSVQHCCAELDSLPAGWTVTSNGPGLDFAPNATSDGTIELGGSGPGISDTGTFTNGGTVEVTGGVSGTIPTFVNTGIIDVAADQTYDLDVSDVANSGTIDFAENGGLQAVDYTQSSAGTLAVTIDGGAYSGIYATGSADSLGGTLAITTQSPPSS
ncbi:MAG TPA: hypothetical protein VMD59_09580, partial [Acidimicrobiales bacterium]|nr:hypothetical protein [Acidimicrobiales bacterium]